MQYNSVISFSTYVEELLLDGNVFKHNTAFPASMFLNLKFIKKITMRNNHFFDIKYSKLGVSSSLISIPKAHLQTLKIEDNLYEDSELNFLFL